MKIKDVLYKTPEMSEEKLLELIKKHCKFLDKEIVSRLKETRKFFNDNEIPQRILNEWDFIQVRESYLTRSQRDKICALVSMCLIQMTKGDEPIIS